MAAHPRTEEVEAVGLSEPAIGRRDAPGRRSFSPPRSSFNHFAQDANFNRGDDRVLEDEWAKAKRVGKSVTVKIVPRFPGASKRPSMINVWWTINGHLESQQFPNERLEKSRGK